MVEISKCKEPCFASMNVGCKILTTDCEGKDNCKFYKPKGCADWIRSERDGKIWLIPPEEYFAEPVGRK